MIFNVYLICAEVQGKKLYKIGFTRRTIEQRISEFKTGNGAEFYIVDSFKSKWGTKIESRIHKVFKSKKISGEWFDLDDNDLIEFKLSCERIHNIFDIIEKNNTYFIDRGGRF